MEDEEDDDDEGRVCLQPCSQTAQLNYSNNEKRLRVDSFVSSHLASGQRKVEWWTPPVAQRADTMLIMCCHL